MILGCDLGVNPKAEKPTETRSVAKNTTRLAPGFGVGGALFAVGKIERDQAVEYAAHKEVSLGEVEKWLAPNLNFDGVPLTLNRVPEAKAISRPSHPAHASTYNLIGRERLAYLCG